MLRRNIKKLRHILATYLAKNLLKAVTEDEILIRSGKDWMIGEKKLSREQIMQIRDEAESFRHSMLYKYMRTEIKYEATLQRYDMAKTEDDMIFGKAMLYSFWLINRFIKKVSTL
jgi:hypothetical protein